MPGPSYDMNECMGACWGGVRGKEAAGGECGEEEEDDDEETRSMLKKSSKDEGNNGGGGCGSTSMVGLCVGGGVGCI